MIDFIAESKRKIVFVRPNQFIKEKSAKLNSKSKKYKKSFLFKQENKQNKSNKILKAIRCS